MYIDSELGRFTVDSYCKEAKEFTGHDGLCTECPFGDCIYSLKSGEKHLILNAEVIKQAYCQYDNCQNMKTVSQALNATYAQVKHWIYNRDKIEQKLKIYAPV